MARQAWPREEAWKPKEVSLEASVFELEAQVLVQAQVQVQSSMARMSHPAAP